jgi:hypothetical protein
MISVQTSFAFIARENRFTLFRIMLQVQPRFVERRGVSTSKFRPKELGALATCGFCTHFATQSPHRFTGN